MAINRPSPSILDTAPGALSDSGAVVPVSLLVSSARLLLERQLGLLWISGEISDFSRAASGHCYFTLKDQGAQVRCVFFRQKAQFAGFPLRNGLQIEVRATATIYEARGEFQLNVETARQAGLGALYEKFAKLKARLDAAGWFAAERKRPLPPHPRTVGIVTSTRAAALADLLTTLARRSPGTRVIVYPSAVQGAGAAAEIAEAIRVANARAEVDVLIVARGGGSLEDLWAYNEEVVAAAIFASVLPVVSGVGHETDFTIADFVADLRAPTPTAAAMLVVADRLAALRQAALVAQHWQRAFARLLETQMQRVDGLSRRLVHPAARLAQQRRDVQLVGDRISRAARHRLIAAAQALSGPRGRLVYQYGQPLPQRADVVAARDALLRTLPTRLERLGDRVDALQRSLAHLNPEGVLARGYALVTASDGTIVQDAAALTIGAEVGLAFARGRAGARITKVG
jgi:exodeoxyribonuclease VII large subunit